MNIFATDQSPTISATELPDRHIVKMPLESVQMLVSVCNRYGVEHGVLTTAGTVHRGGYPNHPCTVWAGDARLNAMWLHRHGLALCEEYTHRYGKRHACESQLLKLGEALRGIAFERSGSTTFALAMHDHLKVSCPHESYRRCIAQKVIDKPGVFVWEKGRAAPEWLEPTMSEVMHGVAC